MALHVKIKLMQDRKSIFYIKNTKLIYAKVGNNLPKKLVYIVTNYMISPISKNTTFL